MFPLGAMELSMAHAQPLPILLTALGIIVVAGTTSFAQQTVTPFPQPQLLPQTSTYTTCTLGCDMQAMGCQSQCVPIGPFATSSAATSQCPLSCATQQLVCKQNCR
jgi:hypothetical protein